MSAASPLDFTTLTTAVAIGPGRFRADIPDGWQQGRGAFGGLVLALLTRAATAVADSAGDGVGRPLRSLTATLCGPTLPGAADVVVEALRAGTGVSALAARLVQGGEVQAHAVALFGRERGPGSAHRSLPPPAVPGWQQLAVAPIDVAFAPVFARHVEFRLAGQPPFIGAGEAHTAGWVRLRQPGRARDAAHVVALADAFWPSAFVLFGAPRPMGTIAFTLDLLADPAGLDPAEPLLHVGRTPAIHGGYAVEERELWSAAGELVALSRQTLAVIR